MNGLELRTHFPAAMPPDVRKGSAFPQVTPRKLWAVPADGRSPSNGRASAESRRLSAHQAA
jgi:hypothetical protein